MTPALVEFVLRFRERERENAREQLTLEIAGGVRVAVAASDRTPRQPPLSALPRRASTPALRA